MVVEMGNLSEDLVTEIFDRIPIKQLTRMKCLSKGWYSSISHYRRCTPRSSNSTFVCQYKFQCEQEIQVMFCNAKEKLGGDIDAVETQTLEKYSLGYSINNTIQFVGSSNGLILCYNNSAAPVVTYVCNLILNQCVSLPPICIGHLAICMGLAFDGVPQRHFKVVLCYVDYVKKFRKRMNCHIYSSDTGIWKKQTAKLVNSSILAKRVIYDCGGDMSYLYRKGMVHWIFTQYMLVYHFENNFFKVIDLSTDVECIWESEGYMYCGVTSERGFCIWKFVDDALYDSQFDDEDAKAKMRHCINVIEFHSLDLKPHFKEILGFNSHFKALRLWHVQILGFDDDLQILYLGFPYIILTYSFETKKLKKVLTSRDICGNNDPYDLFFSVSASFSMQPSWVDLSLGGVDCKVLPLPWKATTLA